MTANKKVDTTRQLSFVEFYQAYNNFCTDAPTEYSWWLGVQLLGHAMTWNTIHLIQPGAVYHNLYLVLVGESTLSRKTTSQNLGEVAYPASATIAAGATPERFVSDMSDEPHRMLWYGEFSELLKAVTKTSYKSTLVEILNVLYDCPREKNLRSLTKQKGKQADYIIKKSYLSINATVTPEMLEQNMNTELMSGGFLPRWVLVSGTPRTRPRGRLKKDVLDWKSLIEHTLTTVMNWSHKKGVTFVFDDEALSRLEEISQEAFRLAPHVKAFVGRYLDVLVKVADILLVSDALRRKGTQSIQTSGSLEDALKREGVPVDPTDGESFVVDKKFLNEAWEHIKLCLVQAENLNAYVDQGRPVARLHQELVKEAPIGHSVVMRRTKNTSPEMKIAVETLLQQDWLIKTRLKVKANPRAKRPYTSVIYCRADLHKTKACGSCEYKALCHTQNK